MSDTYNPYQWPAATTPHSTDIYRIRVGLPVSFIKISSVVTTAIFRSLQVSKLALLQEIQAFVNN